MMHRLFKLEREAEQRVHDARDREIDLGGPGSARRASEAMNAPMLEVAKIRKLRQRLGDAQMAIDHNNNLLRKTKRNSSLPTGVKQRRIADAEIKQAGLKSDFNELEAEAEQKFFGGTPQSVLPPLELTPPIEDRTPPLPGIKPGPSVDEKQPPDQPSPRLKPELVPDKSTPPLNPVRPPQPEDLEEDFPRLPSEFEDEIGEEDGQENNKSAESKDDFEDRGADGENRPKAEDPDTKAKNSNPAVEDTEKETPPVQWGLVRNFVTTKESFNTNNPIRIEMNSMSLLLDGIRFTVDWHPLDKNGNRETVVQSEDYPPEYGSNLFTGVPVERILEPPFDHPYGFEVTVTVPPQSWNNESSAGPYLNIYRSD